VIGQQEIVAMRRTGLAPRFVWVSDFPDATLDGRTVIVAGDTPELEDFRFLVGLTAIVEGADPERVKRIASACAEHAARVIASTFEGRFVVAVSDTEKVMTWQQ